MPWSQPVGTLSAQQQTPCCPCKSCGGGVGVLLFFGSSRMEIETSLGWGFYGWMSYVCMFRE